MDAVKARSIIRWDRGWAGGAVATATNLKVLSYEGTYCTVLSCFQVRGFAYGSTVGASGGRIPGTKIVYEMHSNLPTKHHAYGYLPCLTNDSCLILRLLARNVVIVSSSQS